jgi:hypothetical protein
VQEKLHCELHYNRVIWSLTAISVAKENLSSICDEDGGARDWLSRHSTTETAIRRAMMSSILRCGSSAKQPVSDRIGSHNPGRPASELRVVLASNPTQPVWVPSDPQKRGTMETEHRKRQI